MGDNKNFNLNQYSNKKEYPPLQEPVPDSTPRLIEDYKAVEDSKNRKFPRFRIIDKSGKSYGCSYAHLISWVYEPSSLLTLTVSDKIFAIEGKNLGKIEKLLIEEKVSVLREFSSDRHKMPKAENETVITGINLVED